MSLSPSFRRLVAASLLLVTTSCFAAELDIITKARERLGGEKLLAGVHSIHFVGHLVLPNGDTNAIEIIVQAPMQQRLTVTTDTQINLTALDGYDAWQRAAEAKNPSRWRLTLLGKDQLKRLRANTQENLNFFKTEGFPGTVEDLGLVTVDGKSLRKIAYHYDSVICFYRYFEPATGRLVVSETDDGMQITEEGELMVDGVRFAKEIHSKKIKSAPDSKEGAKIVFDKITLNETFSPSLFSVPMPKQNQ